MSDITFEAITVRLCSWGMCHRPATVRATKHFSDGVEATSETCHEHKVVIFG